MFWKKKFNNINERISVLISHTKDLKANIDNVTESIANVYARINSIDEKLKRISMWRNEHKFMENITRRDCPICNHKTLMDFKLQYPYYNPKERCSVTRNLFTCYGCGKTFTNETKNILIEVKNNDCNINDNKSYFDS